MESNNENKKIVRLDLTKCKSWWDLHERIRVAFDFPEWYGKNWDAFWDLLWSECDADKVEIVGEHTLRKEFKEDTKMIYKILNRKKENREKHGELFDIEVID